MEKKNVVIYVAGQRFSISTADTPEYVMGIGEKIDVMIKGIQNDNPKLNRDACAILTALNICDDETKLRQMLEVLREQVKDYLDANETLRTENAKLKEELEALKNASACATTADTKAEESNENIQEETANPTASINVPAKTETTFQRQTAFVGKDFRHDRHKKNKHHKHHKQNRPVNTPAPVASTQSTPDEAQVETNSPFHQFSIFDDLV